MCDECEEAERPPVLVGKMNRYGWRPPRTPPRCDDASADRAARSAPVLDDRATPVPPCA
jgi:hypothetical protein